MASMLTEYNFDEHMEVDNKSKSDLEDGEVSDTDQLPTNRVYENDEKAIFSTGVDIFNPEIQGKLDERAKRFNIDPKTTPALTDEQINSLYTSLGIFDTNNRNIRFDAVHIRGTEEMSTEDVFQYFKLYGPATIEWINDYSCNVVWLDKSSAARALKGMSKAIKGLTQREKIANEINDICMDYNEDINDNTVDINTIHVPIPPGYWRLGESTSKAKNILLRYATNKDKKQLRAEKQSGYYKKYGNPNYGGMRGIITDRKRKLFYKPDDIDLESGKKNPWGDLSKMWASSENTDSYERNRDTKPISKSLKDRIGVKRVLHSNITTNSENSDTDEDLRKRIKLPRMKMYADIEEQRIQKKRITQFNIKKEINDEYSSEDEEYVIKQPRKPDVKSRLGNYINDEDFQNGKSDSYESDIDTKETNYASVINVIRPQSPVKPTLASIISKSTIERRRNNTSESSECSEENSRESTRRKSFSRPGFDKADLRSRLSNKSIYKNKSNALKVEVDNEYYSD